MLHSYDGEGSDLNIWPSFCFFPLLRPTKYMRIHDLRFPSLDQLRGFVAVGRRMSITQAAVDLHLTQSAVSRQISTLEEALGRALFIRRHRSLAFTRAGAELFQVADPALTSLAKALAEMSDNAPRRRVTISASLGVTALWLLPRIGKLQSAFPEIELSVTAENRLEDLQTSGVDIAIRYCDVTQVPENAIRLFGEELSPVAHPTLAHAAPCSTEGLSQIVLLEYEDDHHPFLGWRAWLAAHALNDAKPRGLMRFNHYDQLIQAAAAGQGVALGRFPMIENVVASGKLMEVGNTPRLPLPGRQYCLVTPQMPPLDALADIIKWLEAEASLITEPA